MDRPELREKIHKLLEAHIYHSLTSSIRMPDLRGGVIVDAILALIEPLIEEAKNTEQIDAMLVEARRTAKKQEREEEAFNIQCCVADAKRVYPNWTIDDVLELLEFREKTRQALKEG